MRSLGTRSFVLLGTVLLFTGCEGDSEDTEQKPTVHRGLISADETWRASDNPHVVRGMVLVTGATKPVLTVEAGVEVRFENGAGLLIGDALEGPGELRAEGTSTAPILMTADSDAPKPGDWLGLAIQGQASGTSRLAHVTIEYAGGIPAVEGEGEALLRATAAGLRVLVTDYESAPPRSLQVEDVTVRKSEHHGVLMMGAGLTSDSHRLSSVDNAGVALKVTANEVGTLPWDSTVQGNTINALHVISGDVITTQTWPDLGVPYQVASIFGEGPYFLRVGSAASPTLTLRPGTELRMPAESFIMVGFDEGEGNIVPGTLKAQGTGPAPIRFVPATATATKGYWSGLFFNGPSGSALDYVTVTHGGRLLYGVLGGGNVNVYSELGSFMTHSRVSDSAGCGVVSRPAQGALPDLTQPTLGNDFAGNEGEAQCNGDVP
ncbi:hypothetical protein ACLESD_05120 [Pyxidicoccus sp. 3LFB2]